MDEKTIRELLSRVARQLLPQFEGGGDSKETQEFADRLAEATWNGLVFMLRQSLANGEGVVLDELGCFTKRQEDWIFEPAASLAEAEALILPADQGYEYLSRQALFYLNQGVELLRKIPYDLQQPFTLTPLTPEEKLLGAIFGEEKVRPGELSAEIERVTDHLDRIARRLVNSTRDANEQEIGKMKYRERIYRSPRVAATEEMAEGEDVGETGTTGEGLVQEDEA